MQAQAVVFDLGGVLTTSPLPTLSDFIRDAHLPRELVYAWFTNPVGAWARYKTGTLDERDVLSDLAFEASQQGLKLNVDGFVQAFFTGFALNKPMIDVVRALRGRIALGCLTNTVRRNGATELFGLDAALFDVVVASCEVGMRKPDPAIYELTCRRLGVGPSDADLASDLLRGSEQDTDQPRGDSGFDVRHVVVKEHDSSPSGVAAKPRDWPQTSWPGC